jgi:hypothetical protein
MGNKCYVPEPGGELVPIVIGNPAAGATWLFTVPVGWEYEIVTVHCKCNTSATPALRQPIFLLNDNAANVQWSLYFSQTLTINFTGNFDLYCGASRSDFAALLTPTYYNYNDALPNMRLLPGWNIGAYFNLLQANDTFTEIRLMAVRWYTL